MMNRTARIGCALLAIATLLAAGTSPASVPNVSDFQGLLLDDEGEPVDGSVDLEFALFDVDTGGAALWGELHGGVPVVEGVYSVSLGSADPLTPDLLEGGNVYLEVTVDGEVLSPRQRLLAVPYAVRSEVAENVVDGAIGVDAIGAPCQTDEVLVKTDLGWGCANAPVANDSVTAASLGEACETGQVLVQNDSGWICGGAPGQEMPLATFEQGFTSWTSQPVLLQDFDADFDGIRDDPPTEPLRETMILEGVSCGDAAGRWLGIDCVHYLDTYNTQIGSLSQSLKILPDQPAMNLTMEHDFRPVYQPGKRNFEFNWNVIDPDNSIGHWRPWSASVNIGDWDINNDGVFDDVMTSGFKHIGRSNLEVGLNPYTFGANIDSGIGKVEVNTHFKVRANNRFLGNGGIAFQLIPIDDGGGSTLIGQQIWPSFARNVAASRVLRGIHFREPWGAPPEDLNNGSWILFEDLGDAGAGDANRWSVIEMRSQDKSTEYEQNNIWLRGGDGDDGHLMFGNDDVKGHLYYDEDNDRFCASTRLDGDQNVRDWVDDDSVACDNAEIFVTAENSSNWGPMFWGVSDGGDHDSGEEICALHDLACVDSDVMGGDGSATSCATTHSGGSNFWVSCTKP